MVFRGLSVGSGKLPGGQMCGVACAGSGASQGFLQSSRGVAKGGWGIFPSVLKLTSI